MQRFHWRNAPMWKHVSIILSYNQYVGKTNILKKRIVQVNAYLTIIYDNQKSVESTRDSSIVIKACMTLIWWFNVTERQLAPKQRFGFAIYFQSGKNSQWFWIAKMVLFFGDVSFAWGDETDFSLWTVFPIESNCEAMRLEQGSGPLVPLTQSIYSHCQAANIFQSLGGIALPMSHQRICRGKERWGNICPGVRGEFSLVAIRGKAIKRQSDLGSPLPLMHWP